MAKEYLDLTGLSYYTDNIMKYISEEVEDAKRVLVFENRASFPDIGVQNYIYLDINEPQIYAWNGTIYIKLGGGSVGLDWEEYD